MTSFALVTEGITDQVVLENILSGRFGSGIDVRQLQPLRDETDNARQEGFGGWALTLEYCRHPKFREALQYNDYIVIQLDTDVSEERGYDVPKLDEQNQELPPERLVAKVISRLEQIIGGKLKLTDYPDRIIYAISVHSLECWLLAYHAPTQKQKQKFKQCENHLRRYLAKSGKKLEKTAKCYSELSKGFRNKNDLIKTARQNTSLRIFLEALDTQVVSTR